MRIPWICKFEVILGPFLNQQETSKVFLLKPFLIFLWLIFLKKKLPIIFCYPSQKTKALKAEESQKYFHFNFLQYLFFQSQYPKWRTQKRLPPKKKLRHKTPPLNLPWVSQRLVGMRSNPPKPRACFSSMVNFQKSSSEARVLHSLKLTAKAPEKGLFQ